MGDAKNSYKESKELKKSVLKINQGSQMKGSMAKNGRFVAIIKKIWNLPFEQLNNLTYR